MLIILKEVDVPQRCTHVVVIFVLFFSFYDSSTIEECWSQPLHDAYRSAHADSEISVPLSTIQEFVLRGAEFIWGHPVISGDYLLITSFKLQKYPDGFYSDDYATNRVHCFSIQSGEKIWTLDIGDVDDSPLISKNKVLMPLSTFQCYSIETGELLWESDIETKFMPTLDGDTAYVVASKPAPGVYAVDVCNGEFRRIDRTTDPMYRFGEYIAVADSILYLSYYIDTERGVLAMDSHTGEILWKAEEHLDWLIRHDVLLCDRENVYVLSASGLCAIKKETGKRLWTFGEDLSLSGDLSADDSHIYTCCSSTRSVWCVDKKTGEAVWHSEPLFPDETTFIVLRKCLISSTNYVFVSQYPFYAYPKSGYMYGSCEFPIYALDSRTGAIVWTSRGFGVPPGPLALCRDFLVVGSGSKAFVLGQYEAEPQVKLPLPQLSPSDSARFAIVAGALIGISVMYYLFRKKTQRA